MSTNRILVLGGTHGNEGLGIKLVSLLKNKPIKDVEAMIANPRAVKLNKRFVESDLNRSFGSQYTGTYETKRAIKLSNITKNFDLVIDLHNTQTPDNNCCFMGVRCDLELFDVAKKFDFQRCVEATYDCINKYCLNTISIEISVNDKLDNAEYWYKQIEKLIPDNSVPTNKLDIYQFKRRVTWDEKSKMDLINWEPFKPLSVSDKNNLGLSGIIVPIFIGSKLTEFYATLLEKKREQ